MSAINAYGFDAPATALPATILLVEDEEYVRSYAQQVLELYGYNVVAARNANEALRIFDEHTSPICLLITDIVMPGMNGFELAKRLAQRSPGMKSILVSGYSLVASTFLGEVDPDKMAYVGKPFSCGELVTTVQKLLTKAGGAPLPSPNLGCRTHLL